MLTKRYKVWAKLDHRWEVERGLVPGPAQQEVTFEFTILEAAKMKYDEVYNQSCVQMTLWDTVAKRRIRSYGLFDD